jgi:hypothetical protein
MELLPAKEIAEKLGVDVAMIHYWTKKGRIVKHQPDPTKRRFFFDIEQVRAIQGQSMYDGIPDNFITRKEAGDYLWVTDAEIGYYTRRGYLTKHYVLGNDYNYMLDEAEVKKVPEIMRNIELRRIANLRKLGDKMNLHDSNGRYISKSKKV